MKRCAFVRRHRLIVAAGDGVELNRRRLPWHYGASA
jgi:hypothetical protein